MCHLEQFWLIGSVSSSQISRELKTQIQVNQPCFETKSLSDELFLFLYQSSESYRFFSIVHMIRIRFFGSKASFQQGFRAAQCHSARGSLMTVLSRETGTSGKFDAMFSCHDVFQICRSRKFFWKSILGGNKDHQLVQETEVMEKTLSGTSCHLQR